MNIKIVVKYCYNNSQRKWETAQALFENKRYADCLFFCHLALEFLLKAKVVEKTKQMFPFTHDLNDLVHKADIVLSKVQQKSLTIINTFNIAGRYDDYKLTFYKKATANYTEKFYQLTKQLLLWLKKQ